MTDRYTNTATGNESSGLTIDSLKDAMTHLNSPKVNLYYAKSSYTTQGEYYFIPKSRSRPEFLVCHTDDFEHLQGKLGVYCNLIPLIEYKPPKSIEELLMEEIHGLVARSVNEAFSWKTES